MPLPPLYGHEGTRNRLVGAIASGRLPQALLFEGPRGVGKQRLALWLAQALVCENPGDGKGETGNGEPCGKCQPCRLVLNLSHPDVHWFVPLEPSKKAGDADKQVDIAAGAIADEMTRRREQPLYGPASGLATLPLAVVRLLLRRLALTPALGAHKVFVVGDADRLLPQQSSPEAANALLKTLEEPPANTTMILTSSQSDTLLPTIVSRMVRFRIQRVPDSVVTSFVQNELSDGESSTCAQEKVARSEGSIGKIIAENGGRVSKGGGPDAAVALWNATRGSAADRYALALKQPPFQARGAFTEMVDALLDRLRREARAGGDTQKLAAAIAFAMEAREQAQGNVNPQLLTAALVEELAAQR